MLNVYEGSKYITRNCLTQLSGLRSEAKDLHSNVYINFIVILDVKCNIKTCRSNIESQDVYCVHKLTIGLL